MIKVRVTITLDRDVYERFKNKCIEKDTKMSTKINSLLRKWVENSEE